MYLRDVAKTARAETGGPTIHDETASRIRQDIISGVYYPRERLVETELAQRYGVKRAVIRTALIALTSEGLVEREQNKGARVRAVSVDEAIEIAEVRLALQGLCAAYAARRASAAQKKSLTKLLDQLRRAVKGDDLDTLMEANLAITARIREIAGHSTANRFVEQLMTQSYRRSFPFVLPDRRVDSLHEHERIVEAIVAGDPDTASQATHEHLEHVVSALKMIRDQEPH